MDNKNITEISAFASSLLDDTVENVIFWSRVGEWGGYYHSVDFREINQPLFKWTDRDPFALNGWKDVYITNILSGFVLLTKTSNVPPVYYLYIQPSADSNFCLVNCEQEILKTLYDTVSLQLDVSYHTISDFMETYFAHKAKARSDNDERLSE